MAVFFNEVLTARLALVITGTVIIFSVKACRIHMHAKLTRSIHSMLEEIANDRRCGGQRGPYFIPTAGVLNS